jgi:cell division septation protein DedD
LAHQTQDDGFHEIQLNGKQLVFLFMAATVVSVVIFLCGVLVGRGVVTERSAAAANGPMASADTIAAPEPADTVPAPPAGSDPTAAAPPTPVDDLSFFERLDESEDPKEELKPVQEVPVAPAKPAPPAPAQPTRAAPAPTPVATSSKPAALGDFAVQVAALNAREEAEGVAKRLATKGYEAYVVPPGNGAVMYRVRVGHFKTRREAEPVSAKLQKEEQFKPWITR